jgi:F-type H+-transporting ATPase subunit b
VKQSSNISSKVVERSRWALQMLFVLSLVVTALPKQGSAQAANPKQPVISDLPAKRKAHAPATSNSATSKQQKAVTPSTSEPKPETAAPQTESAPAEQQPIAQQPTAQEQTSPSQQVVAASNEAAKNKEAQEEPEENAAFRYSKSVKWFSSHTGMDVKTGYWVFTTLNFAIVAIAILWGWMKVWPNVVRARNERISHDLEEARRTSEEARRRLGDIEARLSKLDTEIAGMRSRAESDGKAEAERMKAASLEEKERILKAADQEIASASAQAQRDLKAFAAEMAINIAQARIASGIDINSDEQLVREFAQRLGKEGHA